MKGAAVSSATLKPLWMLHSASIRIHSAMSAARAVGQFPLAINWPKSGGSLAQCHGWKSLTVKQEHGQQDRGRPKCGRNLD